MSISFLVMNEGYERLRDLDVGDTAPRPVIVTASKRGELSVTPNAVRLLTKAYRPPPRKVARAHRRRDPVPSALSSTPIANLSVADVFAGAEHNCERPSGAALDEHGVSRGRDADDAHAHRRGYGEAVP